MAAAIVGDRLDLNLTVRQAQSHTGLAVENREERQDAKTRRREDAKNCYWL